MLIQEVFWGINHFGGMLATTGVSRGVLAQRLHWLQAVGCLRRAEGPRGRYSLTRKARALHGAAMMAIAWERRHHQTPELDALSLRHRVCGRTFTPVMRCGFCCGPLAPAEIRYAKAEGMTFGEGLAHRWRAPRQAAETGGTGRPVYRNLVALIGDHWSARIIACVLRGPARFEELHGVMPIATNVLSGRLRHLEAQELLRKEVYQERPRRRVYDLTAKGRDLAPLFLSLEAWAREWCSPTPEADQPSGAWHRTCGQEAEGIVVCDQCDGALEPFAVGVDIKEDLA